MSSKTSTSYPKVTKTEKNSLAVGVRNRLAEHKVKGVNAIKAAMVESLSEKNDKGRARFLRLNKAAEKAILSHLKDQSPEVKEDVQKAIADYRKILESKPKQLLTSFMKFSVAQGKAKDMTGVPLIERIPKVKAAWDKLSDKKKDDYKPSAAERKSYESARATFESKIKAFKANKH